MGSLAVLFVLCLSSLMLLTIGVDGKKQIDYDALERAWEAGDAREELRSSGDEQFEALSSKSEEEAKALGPQMVFVTLREDRANALESLGEVASRWKESLWNGGLEVTVYEIEQDKKLLVGLQRGVQVADLRRFLLEQPEVLEFEWNSQTYSPSSDGDQRLHKQQKKTARSGEKSKKHRPKSSRKKRAGYQTKSTDENASQRDKIKKNTKGKAQRTSTQQEPKSEL